MAYRRAQPRLAGPGGRLSARSSWAAPLLIGILAAGLRLWALDLVPFAYDDVDVLSRSRAVLGGELTQVGPLTSWGIPDPPMSVYLMTPPSALPRAGMIAAGWVALLNVAAVLLTYACARRFLGPRVALAAGLLFAVNPWAVYFSRRTWAEIMPLFTVIALWSAYQVVCCRRSRWAVPFFVALALQTQVRILSAIYAPAALLTVLGFPRRWGIRWPLVGIALGVLVAVPYLLYVVTHRNELMARLAEGNRGIDLSAEHPAAELLLWTAAGHGLLPPTSRVAPWLNPLGQASSVVLWVVGLLMAVGVGMGIWGLVRRRAGWEARLLPTVWLVLPIVALLAQTSSVYLHYMVALFPTMFLVIGLPLGALLASHRRVVAGAGALALGAICLVQVVTTALVYRIVAVYDPANVEAAATTLRQAAAGLPREAASHLGTGERYGVEIPYRFWEVLTDEAKREAARLGVNDVWVLAGATNPLTAEVPAVLDYLLKPTLEPYFMAADALYFPIGRPSLVLEAPDVDPAESIERFGTRLSAVPIPSTNRAAREYARLTRVEARTVEQWADVAPTGQSERFQGEVRLLGFRAPTSIRAGDQLTVITYWHLGPSATEPNLTIRVTTADQQRVVQLSTAGSASQPEPRAEHIPPLDRALVKRQVVQIPPREPAGEYRLEVQVADLRDVPLRRLDGGGDRVLLTPIRVTAR